MKAANPKRSLSQESEDTVLAGVEACPIYNINEVLEHRSKDDAWMIIKDKVRDSRSGSRDSRDQLTGLIISR